ncbi:pyrroline-5-carboxylate reductase [Alkaliphilus hydrothermalis]|uniref:Pyrroline-5-carboxylate reductase n=1 Tax=Alkaliphilus hydrothermalis TaxID=1482730 RepID=A0ABS2NLF6_9FIRM|nr:pyrroline-5-carboxylate reductase [Alkaliphilus hydrothermalis]MBM7613778.1 pyrroline-5-carboxylate reductase [Alkaliphilus hydrothermalis]
MEKKIGFIGVGKMAQTIVTGLVANFVGMNENIYISNRTLSKAEAFADEKQVNIWENNVELVKNCDIVFLSVKPDNYQEVLNEIKDFVEEHHILVSMAAGVSIADINHYFSTPKKIVRIMPNVAVAVGEGLTMATGSKEVSEDELNQVVDLLSSIGKVDVINEAMVDMVTTISGCSPAFIALFAEALADGAVLQGVPRDKAYQYAAQALIGTGKMLLEMQMHPGILKDSVTSPGGVTIQGVAALEKKGLRGTVIEAMEACGRMIGKI